MAFSKRRTGRRRTTRIVTGDRVRVIRGNHRDAEGAVLRVLHDQNRVVVQGVNMRTKHQRPTQAEPEGGIITLEGSIHISNVMLIEPSSGDASRVRMRVEPDGYKERIAVLNGNPVPKPSR